MAQSAAHLGGREAFALVVDGNKVRRAGGSDIGKVLALQGNVNLPVGELDRLPRISGGVGMDNGRACGG